MKLRLIDTFSGIGGFSYSAEKLVGGFKTVAFVECEPFCQKVLKKHWPHVEQFHDIRTYNPEPYSADVVCGGFPCQDISVAGQGKGITEETRSGLFYELMRVIRLVRPKFIVLENVAAILTNGLGIVLGELASAGFDCEWACIPASALGACHRRDRWWLVGINKEFTNPNNAGLQEERPEQQTTGIKQYRELGNVAYNQSERSGEYKSRLRGQSKRGDLQTDRDTNQKISTTANPMCKGLQGFRGEHELQESSRERTFVWRNSGITLEQNWKRYISKPVLCRGDDGLSNRVHRLKALGNSIVPQVAAIPLQRVLDLHCSAIDT